MTSRLRNTVSAILVCLMVISLAICAPVARATTEPEGPLSPMQEKVVLTVGVSYGTPEHPEVPSGTTPETNSYNQIALDTLNIEIEYLWAVPREQGAQRFQLAVASGDIPDIMKVDKRDFLDFVEADVLMDLRSAYDAYALPAMKDTYEYFDNTPLERSTYDGKLLAVPYCTDSIQQTNLIYYRNDWLTKLGLEVPKTIDELVEVAIAFAKDDPDGNGLDDTTGLGVYETIYAWSLDARGIFQGYGSYPGAWILKDDSLVYGTIQPETKKALDTLRLMYAEGAMNKEFATLSADQLVADIVASKVGMTYGEWWCPNWPFNNNLQADPTVDWIVAEMPSEDGSPANTIITRNNINNYNIVSANAPEEAAVAAIKLLNLAWDITFVPEPEARYGDIVKPENGYVYNWAPVYTYFANEQAVNFEKLNNAIDNNDPSELNTKTQMDLWKAYQTWTTGTPEDEIWSAWGLWYSRVAKDGGWGVTTNVRERGSFIYNEDYGDPTPTELSKSTTLDDMWKEFSSRYIMGDLPETAWDQFVSDWKNLGGDDWTAEVNAQFADMQ